MNPGNLSVTVHLQTIDAPCIPCFVAGRDVAYPRRRFTSWSTGSPVHIAGFRQRYGRPRVPSAARRPDPREAELITHLPSALRLLLLTLTVVGGLGGYAAARGGIAGGPVGGAERRGVVRARAVSSAARS